VDDVSRAILLCFDENTSGLTLNVCGNESISLSYALMTIESFLGKSANIKFLPRHIGDQIATKGSNLLIKQATGWYPRVDFLQGIKRQIDFS
jgi:nucleoside-diphosphate-sugar epimerase